MKKFALAFVLLLVLCSSLVSIPEIRMANAESTIYIRADGSVEGTTDISTVDNVTYTFTDNIFNQTIVVERDNIVVDGAGHTIQGTGVKHSNGIDLSGRSNVTVKNVQIRDFDRGIYLYSSSNHTISGNNIARSRLGIYLERYGENMSVIGNNLTANNWGIFLERDCYYNSIVGNTITDNTQGIGIQDHSKNNTVSGNIITNNDLNGIWLNADADENIITGNNITNNACGVDLMGFCHNNMFHHNWFVNNTVQVKIYIFCPTTWDNGSEGNYWDDYVGVDSDGDGIGDTPHGGDHYPLVPYWVPPTIYIISPENKTYNVNNVSLAFRVSKKLPSWIGYSLDEHASLTIAGNTTLTELSDGRHSLTVYANDTAGNAGISETIYFAIDLPPSILVFSPENKIYHTIAGNNVTNISLSFTVTETVSWISCSLDGRANFTIAGNTTLGGLSCGSHSITVYAEDSGGNIGASETVYFTIAQETESPEPFPTWIVAVIVIIAIVGVALLVYFGRIRKTTKVKEVPEGVM